MTPQPIPGPTRRELLAAAATAFASPAFAAQVGRSEDITTWSIRALQQALAAKRVSPVEVAEAYLRRIERENPSINAFTAVSRERALAEAQRLTRRRRSDPLPALAGVPVAHKDLLITRGVRTTGGSRLYQDWVPVTDAEMVTRFADAGAVMVGKTNTPEFGANEVTINALFGETLNPRDTRRISGGSSGGSAAALAARLTLVATGTDTGGSARAPAALCGCVGFKPTFGLLPTTGVLPFSPVFDHVGLMTRSVADLTAVLDAIALSGFDLAGPPGLAHRPGVVIRGLRVGVPRKYFFDGAEPGVVAAVEGALAALVRQGALLRDVDLAVSDDDLNIMSLIGADVYAKYGDQYRLDPDVFSENIRFWLEIARTQLTPEFLERMRAERVRFERRVDAAFNTVDVLAMPTVPIVAPPRGEPTEGRLTRNTWPFNAARVPAVSVPCGTGAHDLPVGLQVVGRANDDTRVLAVGAIVERWRQ